MKKFNTIMAMVAFSCLCNKNALANEKHHGPKIPEAFQKQESVPLIAAEFEFLLRMFSIVNDTHMDLWQTVAKMPLENTAPQFHEKESSSLPLSRAELLAEVFAPQQDAQAILTLQYAQQQRAYIQEYALSEQEKMEYVIRPQVKVLLHQEKLVEARFFVELQVYPDAQKVIDSYQTYQVIQEALVSYISKRKKEESARGFIEKLDTMLRSNLKIHDQYQIRVTSNPNGISNQLYTEIYEAQKGIIWVDCDFFTDIFDMAARAYPHIADEVFPVLGSGHMWIGAQNPQGEVLYNDVNIDASLWRTPESYTRHRGLKEHMFQELRSTHDRMGSLFFTVGCHFLQNKQYQQAKIYFEESMARGLCTAGVFLNLAQAYEGLEQQDIAERYFIKAWEVQEDFYSSYAAVNLSYLYLTRGDAAKGHEWKHKAAANTSNRMDLWMYLAALHHKTGEYDVADQMYARALNLGNNQGQAFAQERRLRAKLYLLRVQNVQVLRREGDSSDLRQQKQYTKRIKEYLDRAEKYFSEMTVLDQIVFVRSCWQESQSVSGEEQKPQISNKRMAQKAKKYYAALYEEQIAVSPDNLESFLQKKEAKYLLQDMIAFYSQVHDEQKVPVLRQIEQHMLAAKKLQSQNQ